VAQVVGEGRALPDGKHARLWARVLEHGGHVTTREDVGRARRLEGRVHGDEAAGVEREARVA